MQTDMAASGRLSYRGDLVLHATSWRDELARVERILGGPRDLADPADVRRVLASVAPCIHLEHRNGKCPLGRVHNTRKVEHSNTVMDAFHGAILDQTMGVAGAASLAVLYVAAGQSSAASTTTMTQLGAEYYRAAPTDRQRPTSTSGVTYFFFPTTVANTYLHEFAVFAGAATAAANSGLMAVRWLYDFNKDSTMTLNGQHTLSRG